MSKIYKEFSKVKKCTKPSYQVDKIYEQTFHCRGYTNSRLTQVNTWASFRHQRNANGL